MYVFEEQKCVALVKNQCYSSCSILPIERAFLHKGEKLYIALVYIRLKFVSW